MNHKLLAQFITTEKHLGKKYHQNDCYSNGFCIFPLCLIIREMNEWTYVHLVGESGRALVFSAFNGFSFHSIVELNSLVNLVYYGSIPIHRK